MHNRHIYGLGIESFSLDNGPNFESPSPAHQILFVANVYGLENVANLEELPLYGATLYVSPMKVKHACGAPVRIAAILP